MKTPSQGYDVMHLALFADRWFSAVGDGSGGCFLTGMLVTFVSAFPIMVELRLRFLSLFPFVHLDSVKLVHF